MSRTNNYKIIFLGDGSEAFCVCKNGFFGENCDDKVFRQSSSILQSKELQKWTAHLQVPGMFDLMNAIEESTEVITDHITMVNMYVYGLYFNPTS